MSCDSHHVIHKRSLHSSPLSASIDATDITITKDASPTLHALSAGFEHEPGQTFGEAISMLLISGASLCFQPSFGVLVPLAEAPEKVPFTGKASTSWSELPPGCWKPGPLIIFKDFAGNLKPSVIDEIFKPSEGLPFESLVTMKDFELVDEIFNLLKFLKTK